MAPIPGFLQKKAIARALMLLKLVIDNWDKVKVFLRPVLDRALRVLVSHADGQGALTADESFRLHALEKHRRRKIRGGDGRYGWTFEERIEVILLLEKAYRDNERARWLLAKVQERLEKLPNSGPSDRREEFIDGSAVEVGPDGDSVTISREEYERLRHLAGD